MNCSHFLCCAFPTAPLQARGKNVAVLNAGNSSGGGENRTSRVGFEMDRLQDTADVHGLDTEGSNSSDL